MYELVYIIEITLLKNPLHEAKDQLINIVYYYRLRVRCIYYGDVTQNSFFFFYISLFRLSIAAFFIYLFF
jgi:hypothetical protein